MNLTDFFNSYEMTNKTGHKTFGFLRFFAEEKELIFYDEDYKKLFKEKIKNFLFDEKNFTEENISLKFEENEINIIREDDTQSKRLFLLIQNSFYELNKNSEKNSEKISKKIIKKPKDYQEEIFQKAKRKNSIIFLETGLGKTYIAVMLIKDFYSEPLENNYFNRAIYCKNTTKKVLFLFKTISLLNQQSKVIKYNTNLKIIKFYGGGESFMPSFDKFRGIINRYDIISATPEVLYKYFTLGYLKKEDIGLIIIDECHHAKKFDFMNLILKHFILNENENQKEKENDNLRIIGLTASPSDDGISSKLGIEENIQNLCNNLNADLICSEIILNNENINKLKKKKIECLNLQENENEKNTNYNYTEDFITKKINFPENFNFSKIEEKLFSIKTFFIKNLFFNNFLINHFIEKFHITKFSLAIIFTNFIFSFLFLNEENETQKNSEIFEENKISAIKFFADFYKKEIFSEEEFSTFLNFFNGENKNEEILLELKLKEKAIFKDAVVIEIQKFSKNLNLILKFADNDYIEIYSFEFLSILKNKYFQKFRSQNFENFLVEIESKFSTFFSKKNFCNFSFKSPYVDCIENYFLNKIKDGSMKNNKTIIFIEKRIVTKFLSILVNKFLTKYNLKSAYVMGCSKSGMSFTEEELKENIRSFEIEENCICLFATNVVEEGIDIPLCDNIINIKEIKSMRELIQKSGRARKENSTIFTICENETKGEEIKKSLKNLCDSIEIMRDIIKDNKIKPQNIMEDKNKKINLINGFDFFETDKGAKVYSIYAKKIVDQFIGKLFNDGFSYVKSEMQVKEINEENEVFYKPYLSLPNSLEENFIKIFDGNIKFKTSKEAVKYSQKYEEYFYLKAVKLLYKSNYLDGNLCFTKNYDDLMNVEYTYQEYEKEPEISFKFKKEEKTEEKSEEKYFYINLIDFSPKFFDINKNNNLNKKIALISEFKFSNFDMDLFIPSTQILLLYWIKGNLMDKKLLETETTLSEKIENFYEEENEELNNLENLHKTQKNNFPKVDYNYFSKINFKISEAKKIKINSAQKNLIDFYYIYSLFFNTDSELAFFYLLLNQKFSFSEIFLKDSSIKNKLNSIFKYVDLISDENLIFKDFLFSSKKENYKNSENFKFDHFIKITCVKETTENNIFSFDIDYEEIELILSTVKSDINNYHYFLSNYICLNREKFLNYLDDPILINEELLDKKFNKNREDIDKKIHTISRNYLNFSKTYVYSFSCDKSRKGEMPIKNWQHISMENSEEIPIDSYQKEYLANYGLLIQGDCEFLKTFSLDFNQRMLKYKLNLKNLGRVHKKSKAYYIKKFSFLPKEILHEIKNITIDQIFLYGLFPMILYKLQNDLFYYYQAKALKNRFALSFGELKQFKMNLFIEALNSKSTMESQNYERLEFLGDSVLKFLSSYEVFVEYPNCNRDLLYSKRRIIESNKNLFAKCIDNKNNLQNYLYTSPISFKKFNIKGFESDEVFMFNIGYNRSFVKKNLGVLFKKNVGMLDQLDNCENDKDNAYKIKEFNYDKKYKKEDDFFIEEYSEADRTLMGVDKYLKKSENKNEDNYDIDDIDIDKDESNNNPNVENESDLINTDELELFVENNLHIKPEENKTRIIGNKVLADFAESLVGYLFYMDYISQNENFFNLPSKFLMEIGVLNSAFDLKSQNSFWLENLFNKNCKFTTEQKLNRFAIIDNENFHQFKNKDLLYQAMTHNQFINDMNYSYVNKSYQRLAFLGEAFLSFVVAFYVYDNNPGINECMLHKLKICGINHHVVSSIAIRMNLHDFGTEIKEALTKYVESMKEFDNENSENNEECFHSMEVDENFIIILCEAFHAWIGAVLLDTKSIWITYSKLMSDNILGKTLKKYTDKDNFIEHPKVVILDNFERRKDIFKKIRENGSNRIDMKKENKKIRECKLYEYQLIIDKFVIYSECIFFNRSTIRIAQEKAKDVFMRICDEIDKRLKYGANYKMLELEEILKMLNIPIRKVKY